MQFNDILTDTIVSTGVFEAYDLVSFAGAKITAADAVVAGIAKSPNSQIGDYAPIMKLGICRVKAVGAIAAGGKVVSAAAGGVQAQGAGVNPFGRALTAAADGDYVAISFNTLN